MRQRQDQPASPWCSARAEGAVVARPVSPVHTSLIALICVLVLGCGEDRVPLTPPPPPPPEPTDEITVAWIGRSPRLVWVQNSDRPDRDGWPEEGQTVVWTGHVRSFAEREVVGIEYRWLLDDTAVASGQLDIRPGSTVVLEFPWSWTFERHELGLEIEASEPLSGDVAANNALTVYTDALSVTYWAEQGIYRWMRTVLPGEPYGTASFEDWAQSQIGRFNQMARAAGVMDRLRIDRIDVVESGSLATHVFCGIAPDEGTPSDDAVDLQCGLTDQLIQGFQLGHRAPPGPQNPLAWSGWLMHEIGHVRYLVDVYAMWIRHGTADWVDIREDGVLIAGTDLLPSLGSIRFGLPDGTHVDGLLLYRSKQRGLMGADYTRIDRYSAAALNRIAGHRATQGNFFTPDNIGEFVFDMPAENRLTMTDPEGRLLSGADVWIYQPTPPPPERVPAAPLYSKYYDDEPDAKLVTDAGGRVLLAENPFGSTGSYWDRIRRGVAIVRVHHEGRVAYGFLELTEFNLEYWRGRTEVGEHTLVVDFE